MLSLVENLLKNDALQDLLSSLKAVISNNESTRFITGHVIYNPAYTCKFQLKTTLDEKEERYNCTLCEASFIAKSSLVSHHSVVHDFEGDKSQECPLCNIKFSAYGKLQIHLNTVHEGKKPWNCLECDYATTKRYNLKSHIESVHQGIKKEKKWKCTDCDYASAKRFDLKKHTIAVHQG